MRKIYKKIIALFLVTILTFSLVICSYQRAYATAVAIPIYIAGETILSLLLSGLTLAGIYDIYNDGDVDGVSSYGDLSETQKSTFLDESLEGYKVFLNDYSKFQNDLKSASDIQKSISGMIDSAVANTDGTSALDNYENTLTNFDVVVDNTVKYSGGKKPNSGDNNGLSASLGISAGFLQKLGNFFNEGILSFVKQKNNYDNYVYQRQVVTDLTGYPIYNYRTDGYLIFNVNTSFNLVSKYNKVTFEKGHTYVIVPQGCCSGNSNPWIYTQDNNSIYCLCQTFFMYEFINGSFVNLSPHLFSGRVIETNINADFIDILNNAQEIPSYEAYSSHENGGDSIGIYSSSSVIPNSVDDNLNKVAPIYIKNNYGLNYDTPTDLSSIDVGGVIVSTDSNVVTDAINNNISINDLPDSLPDVIADINNNNGKDLSKDELVDFNTNLEPAVNVEPAIDPSLDPSTDPISDPNLDDWFVEGLNDKFPFCIPFDLINLISVLDAEPKAPYWEFPIIFEKIGVNEKIVVDLSEFNTVAEICRWIETFAFCGFLIIKTRGLIRG